MDIIFSVVERAQTGERGMQIVAAANSAVVYYDRIRSGAPLTEQHSAKFIYEYSSGDKLRWFEFKMDWQTTAAGIVNAYYQERMR